MEEHNYFLDALIFLTAAILVVPFSKRIGLGSVLGYLLAGVLLGPFALSLIHDDGTILHFSEFGVVLLLFLIGLELNPSRLWQLRKPILGLGGLQVLFSAIIISLLFYLLGLSFNAALVVGMGLSLSSTAIVLQTLKEKQWLTTPAGSNSFSVLLFQDIAVIPMIAIVPALAVQSALEPATDWFEIIKAVAAILFIVVGGRFFIRPIFRYIANTGLREIFTAFSLFLVIGIALLMKEVGLSMALGTFLAGVLLAESEYRHELEIDIEPFKGLLMGLFFISVGMSMRFDLFVDEPWLILALVVGVIAIKSLVLIGLARAFKLSGNQSLLFMLLLSQGGEFGFVLFTLAGQQSLLPEVWEQRLLLVIAITMLITPIVLIFYEKFSGRYFSQHTDQADKIEDDEPEVIIAGHGRFGQMIGRLLATLNIPTTVLDSDPSQIDLLRKFGFKVFYGDATRIDLLESAGIASCKVLVLAMDDDAAINKVIKYVKDKYSDVRILARAKNRQHAMNLIEVGVDGYTRETFYSALNLSGQVLEQMGYAPDKANEIIEKFREYDEDMIIKQSAIRLEEEKLIGTAYKARQDLAALFKEDRITSESHTIEK